MKSSSYNYNRIIICLLLAVLPLAFMLSSMAGCKAYDYLNEEEQIIKQNSMLLGLDNFKFGKYTCTGANPKFIIEVDPTRPYYILPSADEIEVPLGTEYHLYLGEPYMQPLRPSETIDVPSGSVKVISILLTSNGQEIIVRGMAVNLGDAPIPFYVGLPLLDGITYFNSDHQELDPRADVFPTVGTDYKFMIGLDEEYSNSILTVKVNGEVIQKDDDAIYTIPEISEDCIVTIEGLQHN